MRRGLRTILLAGLSLAALTGCATAPTVQTAPPALDIQTIDPFLPIVERVASHVWVMRQARPNFAGVVGNVVIIEQSRGIVLVDSGATHGGGQRVVEAVRRLSPKPVTAVIITHWHGDHPLGISALREAWPNLEVIATEATRSHLAAGETNTPTAPDPAWEARRINTLTHTYVDQLQPQVNDQSLSPEEHEGWANALRALSIRAADTPGTYVVMPTRTFRDSLVLPDSVSPVEIRFEGRANTDGDAVVWLPHQRVLAAGDTVVWPVPYLLSVYPAENITMLQRLRARNFAALIPGHGEVLHDKACLDLLIRFMSDVRTHVAAAVAHETTLEAITAQMHGELAPYAAEFAGGNRWYRYWFKQYALDPMVESAYQEARGAPLGPPPPDPQH